MSGFEININVSVCDPPGGNRISLIIQSLQCTIFAPYLSSNINAFRSVYLDILHSVANSVLLLSLDDCNLDFTILLSRNLFVPLLSRIHITMLPQKCSIIILIILSETKRPRIFKQRGILKFFKSLSGFPFSGSIEIKT